MADGSDLVIGAANDELHETLLRKDVGGPPEGAAGLRVVNLQDGSPAIIGFSGPTLASGRARPAASAAWATEEPSA